LGDGEGEDAVDAEKREHGGESGEPEDEKVPNRGRATGRAMVSSRTSVS
jgi:hypothetical protein